MKHIVSYFVIFLASFLLIARDFALFSFPEPALELVKYLPFFLLIVSMVLQFDAMTGLKKATLASPKEPSKNKNNEALQPEPDLALVAAFQEKGRLLDFCMNPLEGYGDEQIASVARMVHKGCQRVFQENFIVEPICSAPEGTQVQVGPQELQVQCKLVGKVKGEGPYTGRLLHKGWKLKSVNLPIPTADRQKIITPYEVEV